MFRLTRLRIVEIGVALLLTLAALRLAPGVAGAP